MKGRNKHPGKTKQWGLFAIHGGALLGQIGSAVVLHNLWTYSIIAILIFIGQVCFAKIYYYLKREGEQVAAYTKFQRARKLMDDIESKVNRWNERSQFVMRGVGNLSRSDMDVLELYAKSFIATGGAGFGQLMEPRGGIADVLKKYELIEEETK